MTIEDAKQLTPGDEVHFQGLMGGDIRHGKFVEVVNDYLVKVEYSDDLTEYNHVSNLFLCAHNNFNDYFEKCDDCGMTLDEMPADIQAAYRAQFEEGDE